MNINEIIEQNIQRLKCDGSSLNSKAEKLERLLPMVGVSSAIIGDSTSNEYSIVEVGDDVYSKYGDMGIITEFKNIDAEKWYQVIVVVECDDGATRSFTADRLN